MTCLLSSRVYICCQLQTQDFKRMNAVKCSLHQRYKLSVLIYLMLIQSCADAAKLLLKCPQRQVCSNS